MESLVNTTRSRGPGYSVQVLVLVLSILGSPLALAQRARTDVIHLKDGDRGDQGTGSWTTPRQNQYLDITGEAGSSTLEHMSVGRITQLEIRVLEEVGGIAGRGFQLRAG